MVFAYVGLALVAVAVIVFLIRRRIAAKAAASLSWPNAEGSITASAVQSHWDQNHRRNTYSAAIQYVYRIEDVEYRSSRVAWGGDLSAFRSRLPGAMAPYAFPDAKWCRARRQGPSISSRRCPAAGPGRPGFRSDPSRKVPDCCACLVG